ncbi:hypothetical protein [Niveispirillum sp. BGYR6]|uniref:hypothetical protein n=1 Tax=Niveispirillum sp. BGYR6 TaxID=2971249 RepID=UPI0022B96F6A|nr:hypothetical protein [Niveispirillum sp. BGYR6]MDG5495844.1 hypothetical protein [Niveispirillum sp. BGYR6]
MMEGGIIARYPADAQKADGLRAAAGLALSGGPFLLVTPHPVIAVPLGAVAGLFLVFALRTLARQLETIRVDAAGLQVTGLWQRRIDWAALERVSLKYYATKRDRSGGWMRLVLAGGGRRLALESQLEGFDAIAARVAEAVLARGLVVDKATRENFLALGHYLPGPD